MTHRKQIQRWGLQVVVLTLMVTTIPWIHRALGCGGGSYYAVGLPIRLTPLPPVSLHGWRPISGTNVAVFTTVRFSWLKYYNDAGLGGFFADLDEWVYPGGIDTISDGVESKFTYSGSTSGTVWDWTSNTSSSAQEVFVTGEFNPYWVVSRAYTIRVRDTGDMTPGTTDDSSDYSNTSPTISWVAPTSEAMSGPTIDNGDNGTLAWNKDTYTCTFSNGSVSFAGLFIDESVSLDSNPCGLNLPFTQGAGQLNSSNQGIDTLGFRGDSEEFHSGCTQTRSQDLYIQSVGYVTSFRVAIHSNTLHYKWVAPGGFDDCVTKRVTPFGMAKNPRY